MRKFLNDFKTFINKGNILDLAIAVVMGGAFGKIVSSFVTNIINPLIGMLIGKVHLDDLKIVLQSANEEAGITELALSYGIFLQALLDFVIIALSIFLALRLIKRLSEGARKHVKETKRQLKKHLAQTDDDTQTTVQTVTEQTVSAEQAPPLVAEQTEAAPANTDVTIELLTEIRDLLRQQKQ